MSDTGRPQNSAQKSKKGRKSWRKNVDITEIETKLHEQREEIIHHGKLLGEVESEDLFLIDEDADEEIEKKVRREVKKLKSSEILENKSKVPALSRSKIGKSNKSKRGDKIQGVDKREMVHLLKLAGKVKGFDKTDERMAKEGIINSKAYDVWDTLLEDEIKDNELPDVLRGKSSTSFTKPSRLPSTIKEAPIKVRNIEILPHAGKSYNPSFDNWRHLIEQEFFKEKPKEDQRLALEEYKDRIQFLIANYEDNEVIEEEDADNDDDGDEDDGDDDDVDEEGEEDGVKLSINPVTEVNIKTTTQRNKEKRYKERLRLEKELKEIKERIKEVENLSKYLEEVKEVNVERKEDIIKKARINTTTRNAKLVKNGKKKLGSRFEVIEGPIEVKLSNELSDSLRKMKPEGNLLYDQMMRLQSKGMIETRRINKGKKKKVKITEKWTYKDFK